MKSLSSWKSQRRIKLSSSIGKNAVVREAMKSSVKNRSTSLSNLKVASTCRSCRTKRKSFWSVTGKRSNLLLSLAWLWTFWSKARRAGFRKQSGLFVKKAARRMRVRCAFGLQTMKQGGIDLSLFIKVTNRSRIVIPRAQGGTITGEPKLKDLS